ncbi:MAG: succinate dehydrogenase iron-sulfur subunit [Archaeoglobaceae archaeon]|nr:succinate dehydrogenase iron-sulfur subunit [Archaeoglobaceae archaeon]MDW8013360.1 succinate dehydrogenase iron-sulfur subunit [Archaeoglobaceae archaeon]
MIFKIKRFDGKNFYFQDFEVPVKKGLTVLDCLFYIRDCIDSSLSFRMSCRMGICGSCAVRINGKPALACETQVVNLKEPVKIEPLDNFKVLKDLVVEFDDFFLKHKAVKPYIIRNDLNYKNPVEFIQKPEELKKYYDFSLCIKCGACYSVCPAAATNEKYLGPAALVAAYRFVADSRDRGARERLEIVMDDHCLWRCHSAMACSEVCPKKIEPAKAIQLLRRKTVLEAIRRLIP